MANDNKWDWLDENLTQRVACDGCGSVYSLDEAEQIDRRTEEAVKVTQHSKGWPKQLHCNYKDCPGHTGWMQIGGFAARKFYMAQQLEPEELYKLTPKRRKLLITALLCDMDANDDDDTDAQAAYRTLLAALGYTI